MFHKLSLSLSLSLSRNRRIVPTILVVRNSTRDDREILILRRYNDKDKYVDSDKLTMYDPMLSDQILCEFKRHSYKGVDICCYQS